jgi:hypothetical protein
MYIYWCRLPDFAAAAGGSWNPVDSDCWTLSC